MKNYMNPQIRIEMFSEEEILTDILSASVQESGYGDGFDVAKDGSWSAGDIIF